MQVAYVARAEEEYGPAHPPARSSAILSAIHNTLWQLLQTAKIGASTASEARRLGATACLYKPGWHVLQNAQGSSVNNAIALKQPALLTINCVGPAANARFHNGTPSDFLYKNRARDPNAANNALVR